jgi:hypothetical protein
MSDDRGDNKIAPRRVVGRPFEKGKSGNPGGRPREIQEIVDLARTNSVDAVNTLARIMRDPDAPHQAQIAAANSMLDRAFGKPKETVDLTGKMTLEALVLASIRHRDPNVIAAAAVEPVAAAVQTPSLSSMVAASYAQPMAVVLDPSWQAPRVMHSGYAREADTDFPDRGESLDSFMARTRGS